MSNEQLSIEGIGQQKATLGDWKKVNKIYTWNSPGCGDHPWTCWDEMESPGDFGDKYGFDAMGFGATEKEAIIEYCEKEEIELPFWW